ncbi:MAG: kelch repeat-containing protein [Bacteroidota bacterium]
MKNNYTFRKLLFLFLGMAGSGWLINTHAQHGWEQMNPVSTASLLKGSCVIGHNIYLFGGWVSAGNNLASAEVYNTETGESILLENMSTALGGQSTAAINNQIYVCGGFLESNVPHNLVQEYDPETDSWTIKKELPLNIGQHTSCVVNNKLYIFGGDQRLAGNLIRVSRSFVYDPETDQWDSIAPMNCTFTNIQNTSQRIEATSCVLDGKIYLFGGFYANSSYISTPEMYDPDKDEWTNLAEMPLPLAHLCNVVYNEKIYLFGGSTEHSYTVNGTWKPSNRVFVYDPVNNSWQEMEGMPFLLQGAEGHRINNYLYLVGGDDDELIGDDDDSWTRVWRFNLDSLKVKSNVSIRQFDQGSNRLFSLQPNHPNPFLENTTISYELRMEGAVELVVYDMLGRKMATIVKEIQVPGQYNSIWNAEGTRPGIYFCELKMNGSSQTIKMVKR